MSDDSETFVDLYRRMVAEVGPAVDGRMHFTIAQHGADAVHRRNADHLMAYVRARRIHAETRCSVGELCSGHPVADVFLAREAIDDTYPASLALSAIALIDQATARAEESGARALRLEITLAEETLNRQDAEQREAALRTEIDELNERLTACEDLVAEAKAGWPTTH